MYKTNTYSTILGDVGVKKWSQFFDLGTWSPIFGHLKMGTLVWYNSQFWETATLKFWLFAFWNTLTFVRSGINERAKYMVKSFEQKNAWKTQHMLYFLKLGIQGCQLWHSHVSIPFNSAQPIQFIPTHCVVHSKNDHVKSSFRLKYRKWGLQKLLPQTVKLMWQ